MYVILRAVFSSQSPYQALVISICVLPTLDWGSETGIVKERDNSLIKGVILGEIMQCQVQTSHPLRKTSILPKYHHCILNRGKLEY